MESRLQNKEYKFLACVIVAVLLIILISSFNAIEPKRVTIISKDLAKINNQIVLWSKYGYKIEVLIAQPIAVIYENAPIPYGSEGGIIYKGDILLIMKKD